MKRVGIDVGGTNTDAALIVDGKGVKTSTTEDVLSGVRAALDLVLDGQRDTVSSLDGVMIGTTHFVDAVVQRRGLNKVAAPGCRRHRCTGSIDRYQPRSRGAHDIAVMMARLHPAE